MNRRQVWIGLGALGAAVAMGTVLFSEGVSAQGGAANVSGEVTKLDKAGAKIELRHGEIKNLDMPPMRMVFRVRDAKMLEGLAVGDKVRFAAEKIDGQFTVVAINKQ